MAKVICIYSEKGGSAKTTTAFSLAYILKNKFKKHVILYDSDFQASLSKRFGLTEEAIKEQNIKTVKDLYFDDNIQAKDLIYKVEDNLSVIFSNPEMKDEIARVKPTQQLLKPKKVLGNYFKSLPNDYFIIIDVVGVNNNISASALYLASHVLITLNAGLMSLNELEPSLRSIDDVYDSDTDSPKKLGILLCNSKDKTGVVNFTKEKIKENPDVYDTFVYDVVIRNSNDIPDSEYNGMDINTFLGNFDYKVVKFKVISKKDMEKFKKMTKENKASEIFNRIAIPKKITSGLELPKEAYDYKIKYRTDDKLIKIKDNKMNIDKCPYGNYESKLFIDIIDINNITYSFELTIKIVKDNVGYDYVRFAEELLDKIGD